jgi:hypothetical protein
VVPDPEVPSNDPPAGGDPVSDYVAQQAAPASPTKAGWASPRRLGVLAALVLALIVAIVVVTRTGDNGPTLSDVGSVQAAGGTTSSRAPGSTIIFATGTIDPATVGTAVPGSGVPTSVAPASVVTVPGPTRNPGNGQQETTTTTAPPPCLPDLAATTDNLVNEALPGFTVTVENLSDCAADNAVVAVDVDLLYQPFTAPTKGQWQATDEHRIIGTWTIGSLAPHSSEHLSFGEAPTSGATMRTGEVRVDPVGQTDLDLSNNEAALACPGALHVAVAQNGPVTNGGTVTLDITVQSEGPCTQSFHLGANGKPAGGDTVTTAVDVDVPGDNLPHTTTVTLSLAQAAPHEVVRVGVSAQNDASPMIGWLYVATSIDVTRP